MSPMTHDPSVRDDADTSPSFAWGGVLRYFGSSVIFTLPGRAAFTRSTYTYLP